MTGRRWTEAQKAEACALAVTLGDHKKAALQTGIPRRTVSAWVARWTQSPEGQAVVVQTRAEVADTYWQVVQEGGQRMLAAVRDPATAPRDLARIVDVAAERHSLLTGAATAHNLVGIVGDMDEQEYQNAKLGMTDEQARALRDLLDAIDSASDEELLAYAPTLLRGMKTGIHLEDAQEGGAEDVG